MQSLEKTLYTSERLTVEALDQYLFDESVRFSDIPSEIWENPNTLQDWYEGSDFSKNKHFINVYTSKIAMAPLLPVFFIALLRNRKEIKNFSGTDIKMLTIQIVSNLNLIYNISIDLLYNLGGEHILIFLSFWYFVIIPVLSLVENLWWNILIRQELEEVRESYNLYDENTLCTLNHEIRWRFHEVIDNYEADLDKIIHDYNEGLNTYQYESVIEKIKIEKGKCRNSNEYIQYLMDETQARLSEEVLIRDN